MRLASLTDSDPGSMRQLQLSDFAPGRFMRASLPSPSTSCIGMIASAARERIASSTSPQCGSAGSRPGKAAHPEVLEALGELGIDASDHVPRKLDDEAVDWADVVVATCEDSCPVIPGKRYVSWELPDPKLMALEQVRELRSQIEQLVQQLVEELDLEAAVA